MNILNSPFLSETSFHIEIERIVREDKLNYLEAVIAYCEEHDVEPETLKPLINVNLRDKIKLSAIDQGYFKQESMLPI